MVIVQERHGKRGNFFTRHSNDIRRLCFGIACWAIYMYLSWCLNQIESIEQLVRPWTSKIIQESDLKNFCGWPWVIWISVIDEASDETIGVRKRKSEVATRSALWLHHTDPFVAAAEKRRVSCREAEGLVTKLWSARIVTIH